MKAFTSFDGVQIAYHDEGEGRPVILLHGYGVDGEVSSELSSVFCRYWRGSMWSHDLAGLAGIRRFWQTTGDSVYADSAMARDVIALIEHLRLDSVDVIGFSMGALTAVRLLILDPPAVKSAILAGIGDYAIEDTILEFPKNWQVPEYVPRPLTHKVWAEERARILDQGEIVPGHLGSAQIIAAQATGADPKVLAAVIRGDVADMLRNDCCFATRRAWLAGDCQAARSWGRNAVSRRPRAFRNSGKGFWNAVEGPPEFSEDSFQSARK
jgi:pimeloyl-ACP methyl ester carboxylesterase